jgi:hypothetical protein
LIHSDRKRFIFFAAGKTGTTSIERALAEYADEIPFDFVGRYERLQGDFDRVCDTVGIPRRALESVNPGRFRRGDAHRDKHYTEFYTPATIDLVRSHYARDIREFGYRFGE